MAEQAIAPREATELKSWTDDPRAQEILASIAADPAQLDVVDIHPLDRWTRDTQQYGGPLVGELTAVWSVYAQALLDYAWASDDYAPHLDFCNEQPTVQQAINGALCIPTLTPITTRARALDPAAWGQAA